MTKTVARGTRAPKEWAIAQLSTFMPADQARALYLSWEGTGMAQMTPVSFNKWLEDMRDAGLARSDAECARLLGISTNSVVTMKKRGADQRTALACRALLHRMEPYQ